VSITYAPYTGQGELPDEPGKPGGAGTTPTASPDATTTPATKKPKPKPKTKTAAAAVLIPKVSGGGGPGAGSGEPVPVGGALPPGLVPASGQVLGEVAVYGEGSGTGGGGPGLGSGPVALGGLGFLGGVYVFGLASVPAKALALRLILGRA